MKNTFLLAAVLLLASVAASAQTTTQKWTTGWDNFSEPISLTKSKINWSVSPARKVNVTFTLVGATPTKLYQVALNFFCTTFPATFGQFPNAKSGGGDCFVSTKQGVTTTNAEVNVGAILTDIHGNGATTIVIGPVASGTYALEFFARDGAGCNVNGGTGDGSDCNADFQSPGPFGTATKITVP
jgi:hypothetical protein